MQKLFNILPNFAQNIAVSMFNFLAYRKRYGGKYKYYLNKFQENRDVNLDELKLLQKNRYSTLIGTSTKASEFYNKLYKNIAEVEDVANISNLPIVNKEMLRVDMDKVYTLDKNDAIVSKTGGTTGKSLTVLFTYDNMQERFAMLDDFRSRFGYRLGIKTAWFSGKKLLDKTDLDKNRFWKTDYLHKVRYYSTFHIKEDNLKYYIANLIKFKPQFIGGFPSTITEIANYGLKHNIQFPENTIKAIFPTAETLTMEMRAAMEAFFKTKVYNQYASSDGAPFIFECVNNKLHLELQSGVFEVLDEMNQPSSSGRLVVTSFTTEGTPLIRYDIGDSITLENEDIKCTCGNNNPLVKEILGRMDDYLYSPEMGKVNLVNIANTLKDTNGVIRFQAVQNELHRIELFVVKDDKIYNEDIEKKFLQNWKDRLGYQMVFEIKYVNNIDVEASGKFRIVKNNIKHLINA